MAALLHIGSGNHRVVEALQGSGLDIRSSWPEDGPAGGFDVAVIEPGVEAPLQVARRLRAEAPDAHIVFLTTPATEAALRRELMIGRIGTYWSVLPADAPDAVVRAVREAVQANERRRRLRTTLGRVNLQLAHPPAAARRTVISDHFLALVLDQLSDAVVALDPDGIVLAWNAAAAQSLGEIRRGVPFGQTLPPEARDAIREACTVPEGRAESVLRSPAGMEYSLRASTLRGEGGQVIGIAVVVRDVTAARNEERRRQLVAEAVRVLASTLDVREALQRLARLLVAEVADLAAADIVEGEDVTRYAAAGKTPRQDELMQSVVGSALSANRHHPSLAAIFRGETVVRNELDDAFLVSAAADDRHLAVLRELRPSAMATVPLRGGDHTVGAILVGRTGGRFSAADVSALEEIARQASTALHNLWSYHAASEASRLKDEFLATLSHELRTPMTSILGWAQILRLDDTPSELLQDGLESIERSARAQAQLIEDLLDLSRMQMGKVHFESRRFPLAAVVRAAVDTVRPAAQARDITLTVDTPAEVTVNGDPDRMQQVIWNLLSNAVKFSDAGSEVRVSVSADGQYARVAVTDHGRGIAPDFLPHVFDRFRQGDAATTRRYGGLGLGLAIVKQLVEMHGGSVQAASPGIGRGATFTVTLPLPSGARHAAAPAEQERPQSLPDLAGVDLLVVEDDPAAARAICTILERAGATVRTAHSVAAALELLRERIPHVLISDMAMPDEDGLALIRAIRGRLHIPAERLPAIALTAFHDVDLRVALLGAGFQRFITKPVNAQALSGVVAALAFPQT